jgi:hypothetical protein
MNAPTHNMATTPPLMPKATALWLIRNTHLTFNQIAAFCSLHALEVQNLADAADSNLRPFDPIASEQVTLAEIKRCEADPQATLKISVLPLASAYTKKKSKMHYVPLAKRGLRPSAIAWFITKFPNVPDKVIISLLGTTAKMIESVRNPDYRKVKGITPEHPVTNGLCTQDELDTALKAYVQD